MEIVGHAALEMTMNVYAHVALDDQRAALGRLNVLLDDPDDDTGSQDGDDVPRNGDDA